MNSIQIILNANVDRTAIEIALAAPGPYFIDVVNNFHPDGPAVFELDLADLDSSYLEAIKKAIDVATFQIADAALVWVITKSGKTFSLSNSYVRDDMSTAKPLTALTNGTPLKVRFDVPGFLTNEFREIDLWVGSGFDPDDVAAVAEIGIALTGTGDEFTISNIVECKVSFRKPDVATEQYIIDYPANGQIITV